MRFEVKTENNEIKVYDNVNQNYITKPVPTKEIADEIAADFNAMEKGDYRPIGMCDLSHKKPN